MKRILALWLALSAGAVQAQATKPPAAPGVKAPEVIAHGRFEQVALYRPKAAASGFVLLLSDDAGWDARMAGIAKALAARGALVAGIDTPALFRNLENAPDKCLFTDGDLENLSHFVQAYTKLNSYDRPILSGLGTGASFAYAVLAQAPDVTFAGGLLLGFSPALKLHKPLCKGEGAQFMPSEDGSGTRLQPIARIKVPLVALQGEADKSAPPAVAKDFVAASANAELLSLPKVGATFANAKAWQPQYLAAYERIAKAARANAVPQAPAKLGDLPVIEIPAQGAETDTFAVILSGDGGWAGLDKEVAASLSAKGVKVVGVDSLRYFWSARTPESTAADVDRIVRYYANAWKKQRVLLIGYSQGADVLPFVVTRLGHEARGLVALAAAMGLSEHAVFEFHMTNWVSSVSDGPETLPEVARISGIPFLCIYGADERDTICPKLENTPSAKVVKLPGGHHFNGNYSLLADEILKAAPR